VEERVCVVKDLSWVGKKWDDLYKAALPPIDFIDNNPAVWVQMALWLP
jgi:hypothetical protein